MAPAARRRGGLNKNNRGKSQPRYGPNKAFFSTRVRDLEGSGSEPEPDTEPEQQAVEEDFSDASSDADDAVVPIAKTYSALLQSLNASAGNGQPAKKRRKLNFEVLEPAPESDSGAQKTNETTADGPTEDNFEDLAEDLSSAEIDDSDLDEDFDQDDEADSDPFELHFNGSQDEPISKYIQSIQPWKPKLTWKIESQEGWKEAYIGPDPRYSQRPESMKLHSVGEIQLKQRLEKRAQKALPNLNGVYGQLAGDIFNYRDVNFYDRKLQNATKLRSMLSLHGLNHVLKTRDRVLKNNLRLSKAGGEDLEYRDQGFTRPKVLFLLPTRQSCSDFVETIVSLYEPEQQENKTRFLDAFQRSEAGISEDKPEDFRALFGGNDDDMFRIGMKFTRKTIKLFSQFYNSDIIFASPLGLRMAIEGKGSKKNDFDFLSSIEIVIVDHADAMAMQNWDHVEFVFEHLNLQPKEAHGCDFSRVREWYLDGHAKHLRQTVLTAAFITPEINRLCNDCSYNIEGRGMIQPEDYRGVMSEVRARQVFSLIASVSPEQDPDLRFKFFTSTIVTSLDKTCRNNGSGQALGTVVFVPSYFDFVRIRNFLANDLTAQNISFGSVSESNSVKENSRAQSHFNTGRHSVLLYTGRAHHFNRYRIRGCKRVIFYTLPDNPIFYQEIAGDWIKRSIANGIIHPNEAEVRVLYTQFDRFKLERVVGTARIPDMMAGHRGDTFEFI